MRHYASSRFVRRATAIAVAIGVAVYTGLPDSALHVAAKVSGKLWIVLGPVGAFCVQLFLQLLTLGEDKALTANEQIRLSSIADERVRYLWDVSGVAVLALCVGLSAESLAAETHTIRVMVSFSLGLAAWTALLAARIPSLYREIRDFRWLLARERNEAEQHRTSLADIEKGEKQPEPKVPEPKWPDEPTQ